MEPIFQIVKNLPKLKPKAIERAVEAFVNECRLEIDKTQFFNHTLELIANCTFGAVNNTGHFWLAHEDGEVQAFAICFVTKDADNTLTYDMKQAWVAKKWRGKSVVKKWFQQLRAQAKQSLCRHINVTSSRNIFAYLRFLGPGWRPHLVILREDI